MNDFLNYFEPTNMKDGINEIDSFLGDWFIRKCMWSSASSIKENASSIKKFYQCMSNLNQISIEEYTFLCEIIKENTPNWLESLREYENYDDDYSWL